MKHPFRTEFLKPNKNTQMFKKIAFTFIKFSQKIQIQI